MAEEEVPLLPPGETVSELKDLNRTQIIFLDPESKKVETIIATGPFGVTEYDPEAKKWVSLGEDDTWRVRNLFNDYIKYHTDWKNERAFDENNKSLALIKFSDGSLNEEWLKENAIFAGDVLKEE
jgi:hypothetical protein